MKRRGRPSLGLVEDALKLDATDLRRLGVFRPGAYGDLTWDQTWGENQTRLAEGRYWFSETQLLLDFRDERRSFRQNIRVVRQQCYFGGYRRWFVCPNLGPAGTCLRCVRCLYLPADATQFGCRRCHRLLHRSAREHDHRVNELSCDLEQIGKILENPGAPPWQIFLTGKALKRAGEYPQRCFNRIRREARKGRISRERFIELMCYKVGDNCQHEPSSAELSGE